MWECHRIDWTLSLCQLNSTVEYLHKWILFFCILHFTLVYFKNLQLISEQSRRPAYRDTERRPVTTTSNGKVMNTLSWELKTLRLSPFSRKPRRTVSHSSSQPTWFVCARLSLYGGDKSAVNHSMMMMMGIGIYFTLYAFTRCTLLTFSLAAAKAL